MFCALCLLLTTCGTLVFANEVTANDVKTMIDGLIAADVTLESWSANANAVAEAAEAEAMLQGDELTAYEVLATDDGTLYSDILDELELIVETGPVYDDIMAIPGNHYDPATGWNEGVNKDNYKDYYEDLVDLLYVIDELTTDQQRLLGVTVLAHYETAYEACVFYWTEDVYDAADAFAAVDASNVAWDSKTDAEKLADYQTKKAQYDKAVRTYDALYVATADIYRPDQVEEVNTELVNPKRDPEFYDYAVVVEKTAEDILAAAATHLDAIAANSMDAVVATREAIEDLLPISIDNCAEIKELATDGLAQYGALRDAIGANYWDAMKDDELEAALAGYKEESAAWMDAATFVALVNGLSDDGDITKENYVSYLARVAEANEVYATLSSIEKNLAPAIAAKDVLDGIAADLATYADNWVAAVVTAIDAIPPFTHSTYTDSELWNEAIEAINAARAAYNELNALANALVENVGNYDTLTDAEARKAEIIADYEAADNVIRLINQIGEVGDLVNDDITLTSYEQINPARIAYNPLTDIQKELVTNYPNLVTAENEFAALIEAKADIIPLVDAFNDAKEAITYTSTDEEFAAVTATYNAVVEKYDETVYGTKLQSLVAGLDVAKEAADKHIAAIKDIKAKGDAFVEAVDAICAKVDIRVDDVAALETSLIAYAVNEDIRELDALIAAASTAKLAYDAAVEGAKRFDDNFPAEDDLYTNYTKDIVYYDQASTIWANENPVGTVEEVEDWVRRINSLYEVIDETCVDATADGCQALYDDWTAEYLGFSAIAQNYLYVNKMDVLSKYIYIGIRIDQYRDAEEIIEVATNVVVPERPVEYNGADVDLVVYKQAIADYTNKLAEASAAISNAYFTYEDSDAATKEIAGVQNAYAALQEKEEECAVRNAALAFDKKVIAAADSFENNTPVTYEKVIELKAEEESLAPEVRGALTSSALLLAVEVDAVEALIAAIGTFDFNTVVADRAAVVEKIEKARNAYDILIPDSQQNNVENYAVLVAAEELLAKINGAIAFAEAVNALQLPTEGVSWEIAKAEADALAEEYNDFDEETKGMVKQAYLTLQQKQAEIVSYMLSILPELDEVRAYQVPADMQAVDAVIDLLRAIDRPQEEPKAGAYRELTPYSKLRVVGYANYGVIVEALKPVLQAYNEHRAAEVAELINAIKDNAGNEAMTYRNYREFLASIEAAEEAYEAYTAEIAELAAEFRSLSAITLSNLVDTTAMTDARDKYDKFADAELRAAPVATMLEEFYAAYPAVENVNSGNYKEVKETVVEIQDAFVALDPDARVFVAEAEAGLDAYYEKAQEIERYMAVVEAIDEMLGDENDATSMYYQIVNNNAFDAEYGLKISDIEAMYAELTPEERMEVGNYAKLDTARESYDANISEAIATTIEKIDAIFVIAELENFALTNGELEVAIDEANDWFNSLSEENQAAVTNADKLAAANDKIASLTDPSDVIAAIEELGDPEATEITDENYDEIKAAVEAARALFETLAEEDKLVVGNLTTLEVWEEKVGNFTPDRSGDINNDGVVTVTDISAMVDCVLRRVQFNETQMDRADLVEDGVIDIFDILKAIELIVF